MCVDRPSISVNIFFFSLNFPILFRYAAIYDKNNPDIDLEPM